MLKSVPLGKYSRTGPPVFSLVGRRRGLWGSAKRTLMSVAGAGAAWLAVCAPRPRVMVEYTARGGESTMLPGASVTVRVRRPAAGRVTGTNRLRRPRQGDQGAAGGRLR